MFKIIKSWTNVSTTLTKEILDFLVNKHTKIDEFKLQFSLPSFRLQHPFKILLSIFHNFLLPVLLLCLFIHSLNALFINLTMPNSSFQSEDSEAIINRKSQQSTVEKNSDDYSNEKEQNALDATAEELPSNMMAGTEKPIVTEEIGGTDNAVEECLKNDSAVDEATSGKVVDEQVEEKANGAEQFGNDNGSDVTEHGDAENTAIDTDESECSKEDSAEIKMGNIRQDDDNGTQWTGTEPSLEQHIADVRSGINLEENQDITEAKSRETATKDEPVDKEGQKDNGSEILQETHQIEEKEEDKDAGNDSSEQKKEQDQIDHLKDTQATINTDSVEDIDAIEENVKDEQSAIETTTDDSTATGATAKESFEDNGRVDQVEEPADSSVVNESVNTDGVKDADEKAAFKIDKITTAEINDEDKHADPSNTSVKTEEVVPSTSTSTDSVKSAEVYKAVKEGRWSKMDDDDSSYRASSSCRNRRGGSTMTYEQKLNKTSVTPRKIPWEQMLNKASIINSMQQQSPSKSEAVGANTSWRKMNEEVTQGQEKPNGTAASKTVSKKRSDEEIKYIKDPKSEVVEAIPEIPKDSISWADDIATSDVDDDLDALYTDKEINKDTAFHAAVETKTDDDIADNANDKQAEMEEVDNMTSSAESTVNGSVTESFNEILDEQPIESNGKAISATIENVDRSAIDSVPSITAAEEEDQHGWGSTVVTETNAESTWNSSYEPASTINDSNTNDIVTSTHDKVDSEEKASSSWSTFVEATSTKVPVTAAIEPTKTTSTEASDGWTSSAIDQEPKSLTWDTAAEPTSATDFKKPRVEEIHNERGWNAANEENASSTWTTFVESASKAIDSDTVKTLHEGPDQETSTKEQQNGWGPSTAVDTITEVPTWTNENELTVTAAASQPDTRPSDSITDEKAPSAWSTFAKEHTVAATPAVSVITVNEDTATLKSAEGQQGWDSNIPKDVTAAMKQDSSNKPNTSHDTSSTTVDDTVNPASEYTDNSWIADNVAIDNTATSWGNSDQTPSTAPASIAMQFSSNMVEESKGWGSTEAFDKSGTADLGSFDAAQNSEPSATTTQKPVIQAPVENNVNAWNSFKLAESEHWDKVHAATVQRDKEKAISSRRGSSASSIKSNTNKTSGGNYFEKSFDQDFGKTALSRKQSTASIRSSASFQRKLGSTATETTTSSNWQHNDSTAATTAPSWNATTDAVASTTTETWQQNALNTPPWNTTTNTTTTADSRQQKDKKAPSWDADNTATMTTTPAANATSSSSSSMEPVEPVNRWKSFALAEEQQFRRLSTSNIITSTSYSPKKPSVHLNDRNSAPRYTPSPSMFDKISSPTPKLAQPQEIGFSINNYRSSPTSSATTTVASSSPVIHLSLHEFLAPEINLSLSELTTEDAPSTQQQQQTPPGGPPNISLNFKDFH